MKQKMRDRRGMAVLVDAFVFLIACAVVSTALVSSLPASDGGVGHDIEAYLEQAHRALLRSSYDNGEESQHGVKPTVQESIQLLLHTLGEEGAGPEIDRFERHVGSMMERLLPSFLQYHWSATCGEKVICAGCEPGDHGGDRYTSSFSLHSPLLRDELVVLLIAWC